MMFGKYFELYQYGILRGAFFCGHAVYPNHTTVWCMGQKNSK